MYDLYFDLPQKQADFQSDNKVLIILNTDEANQDNMDFLAKILGALKLNFSQCDLLKKTNIIQIGEVLPNYNQVIVFGIEAQEIQLNMKSHLYKALYLESSTLLFADKLTAIKKDDKLKNNLWKSLQLVFNLVKP